MRLISQDGKVSVDSSSVVLIRNEKNIYAKDGDRVYLMARYDTIEKAEDVWKKVHEFFKDDWQKVVGFY